MRIRLGLFRGCSAIVRAQAGRLAEDAVQGPELAQVIRPDSDFVDPADAPLATEDAVVLTLVVDRGAEIGRAKSERHCISGFLAANRGL
jgi:hypothetical protein